MEVVENRTGGTERVLVSPAQMRISVAAQVAMLVSIFVTPAFGAHSAFVNVSHDPLLPSFYSGTSNPSGSLQVNESASGVPGYLNGISGGQDGGAAGNLLINTVGTAPLLVGIAVHVTDSAGPSHSLSALNDPALGDIVSDLRIGSSGDFPITEYAYSQVPSQYSSALATLSAGEAANGGQPFDILVVGTNTFGVHSVVWAIDFSNEIGNLDGIIAMSVTDAGALPEPSGTALIGAALAMTARTRQGLGVLPRRPDGGHHFGRLHAQRQRKALDGFQSDGPLPAFDEADMGAMESGAVGQVLLREPAGLAEVPNPLAEAFGKASLAHA